MQIPDLWGLNLDGGGTFSFVISFQASVASKLTKIQWHRNIFFCTTLQMFFFLYLLFPPEAASTLSNFVRCDVRSGETSGKVTYKLNLYSYHIAINLQQIHSCHILLQLYLLSSFGHQHKSLYRSLLGKKQSLIVWTQPKKSQY